GRRACCSYSTSGTALQARAKTVTACISSFYFSKRACLLLLSKNNEKTGSPQASRSFHCFSDLRQALGKGTTQTHITRANVALAAITNRWKISWKPSTRGKGSGWRRA